MKFRKIVKSTTVITLSLMMVLPAFGTYYFENSSRVYASETQNNAQQISVYYFNRETNQYELEKTQSFGDNGTVNAVQMYTNGPIDRLGWLATSSELNFNGTIKDTVLNKALQDSSNKFLYNVDMPTPANYSSFMNSLYTSPNKYRYLYEVTKEIPITKSALEAAGGNVNINNLVGNATASYNVTNPVENMGTPEISEVSKGEKYQYYYNKDDLKDNSNITLTGKLDMEPLISLVTYLNNQQLAIRTIDGYTSDTNGLLVNGEPPDYSTNGTYVDIKTQIDSRVTLGDKISFKFTSYNFKPVQVFFEGNESNPALITPESKYDKNNVNNEYDFTFKNPGNLPQGPKTLVVRTNLTNSNFNTTGSGGTGNIVERKTVPTNELFAPMTLTISSGLTVSKDVVNAISNANGADPLEFGGSVFVNVCGLYHPYNQFLRWINSNIYIYSTETMNSNPITINFVNVPVITAHLDGGTINAKHGEGSNWTPDGVGMIKVDWKKDANGVVKLPTPRKPGYRFEGWYTSENGGERVCGCQNFSLNSNIYAQWEPIIKDAALVTFDTGKSSVSDFQIQIPAIESSDNSSDNPNISSSQNSSSTDKQKKTENKENESQGNTATTKNESQESSTSAKDKLEGSTATTKNESKDSTKNNTGNEKAAEASLAVSNASEVQPKTDSNQKNTQSQNTQPKKDDSANSSTDSTEINNYDITKTAKAILTEEMVNNEANKIALQETKKQFKDTAVGYKFIGWSTEKNDPDMKYSAFKNGPMTVTGYNTVLYAQWKKVEKPAVKPSTNNNNYSSSSSSVSGGSGGGSSSISPDNVASGNKALDRIYGSDRIETANKIAEKYFGKAGTVIITEKNIFPDSLTATVLSKQLNAPILLTSTDNLDNSVSDEIQKLGAKHVIIVGGSNSVSDNVKKQIEERFDKNVERISGSDRYGTSEMVAKRVVKITGNLNKAVVASGELFPDALSVSPFAAEKGYPILLVKKNDIPLQINNAIKDLKINNVYIAGGNNSVSSESSETEKELPKVVNRMYGNTRYETALEIAKTMFKDSQKAFVTSGQVFSDALVIGPVAGKYQAPILLTPNYTLNSVNNYIKNSKINDITVVGGSKYIPESVFKSLNK